MEYSTHSIHSKVPRTKQAATMLFGISEEYIGLLLVIAVCLIIVTIIAVHEGWFNTAPQRATPRGRQRTSPEVQDQPEQVQSTPHQPEGLRQRRGRQRVRGSAEFVRYRLLPYLLDVYSQGPELSGEVQPQRPSAQRESDTLPETHQSSEFVETSTTGRLYPDLQFESAEFAEGLQETSKGQTEHKQYAAIVLFTEDNEEAFEYAPPVEVNPEKPFVPQKEDFNNYIMARPNKSHGRTEHAERIIMNNFKSLKKKFKNKNHKDPVKIILYSWLMPCTDCTRAIISGLSGLAQKGVKVELYYTCDYDDRDTQTENRFRLEDSKISVDQI